MTPTAKDGEAAEQCPRGCDHGIFTLKPAALVALGAADGSLAFCVEYARRHGDEGVAASLEKCRERLRASMPWLVKESEDANP